jgi:hypothetical protein
MNMRGYDREQVDAWLAGLRATRKASSFHIPGPELVVVLRGYDVAETNALLATVGSALAGGDPFRRAEAVRAIAEARLPVSLRGYDRARVDACLETATQALRVREWRHASAARGCSGMGQ